MSNKTNWLLDNLRKQYEGKLFGVAEFEAELRDINERDYTDSSRNTHRSAARLLYKERNGDGKEAWTEMRWIMERVVPRKRGLKRRKLPVILTDKDVATLIDKARSDRQRLFVSFLAMTGMRVGEVVNIRRNDVEPLRGGMFRIQYQALKNGPVVYRDLPATLIREIWAVFNGNEYLFETQSGQPYRRSYISNQVAKIAEAFIGKKASAHRFRNYRIWKWKQEGVSDQEITRRLGHKNPGSWQRHYDYEDADYAQSI